MSLMHVVNMKGGKSLDGGIDTYNQGFYMNKDKELLSLVKVAPTVNKPRPFDWFICSVFGYFCFCWTGVCAMYYAVRTNQAVDWGRDEMLITDYAKKAKMLTLLSIGIGTTTIVIFIMYMLVYVNLS